MRAVLFDLDGTLMDHDAARDAAIGAHLPGLPALPDEWRRLEAIHYDEYAAGRCSFQEQRRRRVRGIHAAMGGAEPADAACDAWFATYLERYRAGWHGARRRPPRPRRERRRHGRAARHLARPAGHRRRRAYARRRSAHDRNAARAAHGARRLTRQAAAGRGTRE